MPTSAACPALDDRTFLEMKRRLVVRRLWVLFGLALVCSGICGATLYLFAFVVPAAIIGCLLLMFGGCAVLQSHMCMDDLLLPGISGVTLADLIATAVAKYKEFMSSFLLLVSVPRLTGHDVVLIARRAPEHHTTKLPPPAALAPVNVARRLPSDDFNAAVLWLQRPQLSLGLLQQLRLKSLYLQATSGDAGPSSSSSSGSVLDRAQKEAWQALRGLPSASARERLPLALAEVDACFSAAQPRLAARVASGSGNSLALVTSKLLEQRLPASLEEKVMQAQQMFLAGSLVTSVLAVLRALLAAFEKPHWRAPLLRMVSKLFGTGLLSVLASLYFYGLAKGFPAWLHAALLLRKPLQAPLVAGDAAYRLRSLVLRMVMPRISKPLLAIES